MMISEALCVLFCFIFSASIPVLEMGVLWVTRGGIGREGLVFGGCRSTLPSRRRFGKKKQNALLVRNSYEQPPTRKSIPPWGQVLRITNLQPTDAPRVPDNAVILAPQVTGDTLQPCVPVCVCACVCCLKYFNSAARYSRSLSWAKPSKVNCNSSHTCAQSLAFSLSRAHTLSSSNVVQFRLCLLARSSAH